MTEDERWNQYFIEGTDILKNRLNITDMEELKEEERKLSAEKLIELYLDPIEGKFDAEHLCKIHKYIFDDIYYFAGEYRNVNIGKSRTASFCKYENIETFLNKLLYNIDEKILSVSNSKFLYAEALAELYHRLIDIHPFREGNGRAIREFVREYVQAKNKCFNGKNYMLDFTRVDRNNFFEGTVNPISTMGQLKLEFFNALVEQDEQNTKTKK